MSGWWGAVAVVLAWVVAVNVGRVRRLDRLHRRLDATRIGLSAALQARWHAAERVAVAIEGPGSAPPARRVGGTPESRSAERGSRVRPQDAEPPGQPARSRSAERDRSGRGAPSRAAPEAGERSAERDGSLWVAVAAACSAGPDREAAENALGRVLAGVDRSRLPEDLHAELGEAELRLALARRVHNDAVRDTLALRSRRLVRWLRLAGSAPMPAYFEIADPPGVTGHALSTAPAGPPG